MTLLGKLGRDGESFHILETSRPFFHVCAIYKADFDLSPNIAQTFLLAEPLPRASPVVRVPCSWFTGSKKKEGHATEKTHENPGISK